MCQANYSINPFDRQEFFDDNLTGYLPFNWLGISTISYFSVMVSVSIWYIVTHGVIGSTRHGSAISGSVPP